MPKLVSVSIAVILIGIASAGCDAITGNNNPAPTQPVAVQQAPVQPAVAPAQQVAPVAATGVQQPQQQIAGQVPGAVQQPVVQPGTQVAAQPGVQPGVQAQQVATPPAPTGDVLIDKLNARKFAFAAAFTPTSTLTKGTLEKNKTQAYQVQLPGPPYCHTFIAVTHDTIQNIDLSLTSPSGTPAAVDSTQESTATIQNHCPTTPGPYKLAVAMPEAGGEFAVQVFSR